MKPLAPEDEEESEDEQISLSPIFSYELAVHGFGNNAPVTPVQHWRRYGASITPTPLPPFLSPNYGPKLASAIVIEVARSVQFNTKELVRNGLLPVKTCAVLKELHELMLTHGKEIVKRVPLKIPQHGLDAAPDDDVDVVEKAKGVSGTFLKFDHGPTMIHAMREVHRLLLALDPEQASILDKLEDLSNVLAAQYDTEDSMLGISTSGRDLSDAEVFDTLNILVKGMSPEDRKAMRAARKAALKKDANEIQPRIKPTTRSTLIRDWLGDRMNWNPEGESHPDFSTFIAPPPVKRYTCEEALAKKDPELTAPRDTVDTFGDWRRGTPYGARKIRVERQREEQRKAEAERIAEEKRRADLRKMADQWTAEQKRIAADMFADVHEPLRLIRERRESNAAHSRSSSPHVSTQLTSRTATPPPYNGPPAPSSDAPITAPDINGTPEQKLA